MRFDLSGRGSLGLVDPDPGLAAYITSQMAPFPPLDGGPADLNVILEPEELRRPLTDLQNAADDDLVTGTDGERLFVVWDGRRCAIPDVLAERPARFSYEPGFPMWRVFRSAIRPALQLSMVADGAVTLHAAAVEVDGAGLAIAGWSESGKTEAALGLMEGGASFLSDKWTVLGADGGLSAFPMSIGVRRWVLDYLPTLRASQTGAARAQFTLSRAASLVLGPLGRRRAPSRAAGAILDAARRATALGDRAAFTVEELRAIYGESRDPTRRLPTRAVVLLTTVPEGDVVVEPEDGAWAAARLARSAAFERRAYLALLQRAGFALPARPPSAVDRAIEGDAALLRRIFADVAVLGVRSPFPIDPRRVADAVRRALQSHG